MNLWQFDNAASGPRLRLPLKFGEICVYKDGRWSAWESGDLIAEGKVRNWSALSRLRVLVAYGFAVASRKVSR